MFWTDDYKCSQKVTIAVLGRFSEMNRPEVAQMIRTLLSTLLSAKDKDSDAAHYSVVNSSNDAFMAKSATMLCGRARN